MYTRCRHQPPRSSGAIATVLNRFARLSLIPLLLSLGGTAVGAKLDALDARETEEGVLITDGGQPVLFYQRRTKSHQGKMPRANYIHPLYGLDGHVLTEDFPEDHLHHRGVFLGWHQLTVDGKPAGNPWRAENIEFDVRDIEILSGDKNRLTLATHVWWRSHFLRDSNGEPKPIVREKVRIQVGAVRDDVRPIDFDIRLQAMVEGVRLGGSAGKKAYGGFTIRLGLPDDVRFTSEIGELEPIETPLTAGPWMDLAGTFDAETGVSGLTILCHPETPGMPRRWVLRRGRSMQNQVYPGRVPVPISKETPVRLRYRMLIHRGELAPERIAEMLRQYGEEK